MIDAHAPFPPLPSPSCSDPNVMSGGYAESTSANLFGEWTTNSPGFGAGYSKVVNFTEAAGEVRGTHWPAVVPADTTAVRVWTSAPCPQTASLGAALYYTLYFPMLTY